MITCDPAPDSVTVRGTSDDIDGLKAEGVVRGVLRAVAPAEALTTKVTVGDADVLKAPGLSGMNTAVSECDPTASAVDGADAMPLLTGTRTPRLVAASLNCTLPIAVAGETVAVKVTGLL